MRRKNKLALYLGLLSLVISAVAIAPIYRSYMYAHIYGKSVIRLLGSKGGGTGFQAEYNGKPFVMTNDHVCGTATKDGYMLADSPFAKLQPIKVLYHSSYTDLCILSPVNGMSPLHFGTKSFKLHEKLTILGHPELGPIKASHGEVLWQGKVEVMLGFITNEQEARSCSLPKYRQVPVFFGILVGCVEKVNGQDTTALIKPGSSGSPVLDWQGYVRGVAFAAPKSGKGTIIPLVDILKFIKSSIGKRSESH